LCVFFHRGGEGPPPPPRPVTLPKADAAGIESAEALRRSLYVRSLNDIMIDAAGSADSAGPA
jgi:hypothetical protein